MKKKEILEYIQEQAGSTYISDLKGKKIHWGQITSEMDLKVFSIEEWEEAIAYITGKKQVLNNYSFLQEWFERQD